MASWKHVLPLVALTLVATSLPAQTRLGPRLRPAASDATPVATTQPATDSDQPKPADPSKQPERPCLTPLTELWDNSSTRVTARLPGPALVAALLHYGEGERLAPSRPLHWRDARDPHADAPLPTGWRIGHYPHAPPVVG